MTKTATKDTDGLGQALAAKDAAVGTQRNEAMEELLYHVKGVIDLEGRYVERLKVVSIGYAAGRGVSPVAARTEIEKGFAEKFGHTPHEYLEQQFRTARTNGRDTSRQQQVGMGR